MSRSIACVWFAGVTLMAIAPTALAQTKPETERGPITVTDRARAIHSSAILIDGHNDLPWKLRERGWNAFETLDDLHPQSVMHTDIPRLRAGGVKAQFWSVYVPSSTRHDGRALAMTLEQIAIVKSMLARHPDVFELARTAGDIERISASGKIASMIGVEGGHSIEDSIGVLRRLRGEGVGYMTLTHSDTLDWADSATDEERHGGLTAFGEEIVREMNRLGMLVDLSHVSVATMQHAIRVSKAPVIFSHSSARAIADHPRNVPDEVLKATAQNGGVVMVNFYSGFIVPAAVEVSKQFVPVYRELRKQYGADSAELRAAMKRWSQEHPIDRGSVHDVLDHIDHIVKVAGIDHVGIGSDFDGIETCPAGLEDVSTYPTITQGLLDRGYSEADIKKILGANLLRAMRGAEKTVAVMKSRTTPDQEPQRHKVTKKNQSGHDKS